MNKDLTEFSALVTRIKGNRSIRKMAEDTDIAASYISNLLKCKYVPSLTILNKLLRKSQDNTITLDDLIRTTTTNNYINSDNKKNLARINPEEIGKHIADGTLEEWCNEVRKGIIEDFRNFVNQY